MFQFSIPRKLQIIVCMVFCGFQVLGNCNIDLGRVDGFVLFNRIKTTPSQPAITRSKLTIKTLEQGVKYVQS